MKSKIWRVLIPLLLLSPTACESDSETSHSPYDNDSSRAIKVSNQEKILPARIEALQRQLDARNNQPVPEPVVSEPEPSNEFTPGKVFRDRLADGSFGPEMVWIPAGSFRMGDIQGGGHDDEKPVHQVSVERFAMGKYEVTVGEFRRFVKASGYKTDAEKKGSCYTLGNNEGASWRDPHFSQSDAHPVVCVSWNDSVAYAEWLSTQTGQTYRLPTEAEWEYAARAATNTVRYWGNDPDKACVYANVADQTAKQKYSNWTIHNCTDGYVHIAPVGKFKPNRFGLYDVLGNIWEWTCSEYEDKYKGKEKRCSGKNRAKNTDLSLRGGSCNFGATRVRSAIRFRWTVSYRDGNLGLRVAKY
jgi:formylglycine-generating enzyme required for sulfatase activity